MSDSKPEVPGSGEPEPNVPPPSEPSAQPELSPEPTPSDTEPASELGSDTSNEPESTSSVNHPEAASTASAAPETSQMTVPPHAVYDPADGPPAPDYSGDIVPFSGPPTERNTKKFTWVLVSSLVGGVLACGGVIVTVVVMMMQLSNAIIDSGVEQADDFMADVSQENWDDAYGQLCEDLQDQGDVADYSPEWGAWDASSWTLQEDSVDQTAAGDLLVSVEMADGEVWELEVRFEPGSENLLDSTICSWEPQ